MAPKKQRADVQKRYRRDDVKKHTKASENDMGDRVLFKHGSKAAEPEDVYVAPDSSIAERYRLRNHPHMRNKATGELSWLSWRAPLRAVGKVMGSGSELYFQLMRQIGFVFTLMFLGSTVWVVLANRAEWYTRNGQPIPGRRPRFYASGTSIAGYSLAALFELEDLPERFNYEMEARISASGNETELSRETFLLIVQGMCLLGAVVFLLWVITSRFYANAVERRVDADTVEVSDYTVFITGLPRKGVVASELAEFAEARFGPVVEVLLAIDDKVLFQMAYARSKAVLALKRARASEKLGESRRGRIARLKRLIRRIDLKILKFKMRKEFVTVGAFVTFNTEESRNKCLAALHPGFWAWLCRNRTMYFKQRHNLSAKQAEPPGNINFDNLQFGFLNRLLRRTITWTAAVVMLILSYFIINEIRFQGAEVADSLDGRWKTNVLARGLGVETSAYVATEDAFDAYQPQCTAILTQCSNSIANFQGNTFAQLGGVDLSYYSPIRVSNINVGQDVAALDLLRTTLPATCYTCYCDGLKRCIEDFGTCTNFDAQIGQDFSLTSLRNQARDDCDLYIDREPLFELARFGASFVIVLFNFLMRLVLEKLTAFEKHQTQTDHAVSVMLKIIIVHFINIALIDLFSGARLEEVPVGELSRGRFFSGEHKDFTPDWYSDVGNTMLATLLVASFAPMAGRLWNILYDRYKRRKVAEKCIIQEDLNRGLVGPQPKLYLLYAELVVVVLVALVFGAGVPLMYFVVLLKIVAFTLFDRYYLTRVARSPARYNQRLWLFATGVMRVGLMLHCFIATWMLSHFIAPRAGEDADSLSATEPQSEDTFNFARIVQINAVGMLVLGAAIAFWEVGVTIFIGSFVWEFVLKGVLFNIFCFCLQMEKAAEKAKLTMTYKDAYESLALVGPRTYDVVELPKYRQAFEIQCVIESRAGTPRGTLAPRRVSKRNPSMVNHDEVQYEDAPMPPRTAEETLPSKASSSRRKVGLQDDGKLHLGGGKVVAAADLDEFDFEMFGYLFDVEDGGDEDDAGDYSDAESDASDVDEDDDISDLLRQVDQAQLDEEEDGKAGKAADPTLGAPQRTFMRMVTRARTGNATSFRRQGTLTKDAPPSAASSRRSRVAGSSHLRGGSRHTSRRQLGGVSQQGSNMLAVANKASRRFMKWFQSGVDDEDEPQAEDGASRAEGSIDEKDPLEMTKITEKPEDGSEQGGSFRSGREDSGGDGAGPSSDGADGASPEKKE
ncbi:unnamed protein product [Pedinophyceae sp. YPF-701]|nr:unnamed protein product [Pedinophyceae sp. YPF-701]